MLASPSPDCHSVEMDIYLGQSVLSGPSFISLPDSSGALRDTSTSVSACSRRHTCTCGCSCVTFLHLPVLVVVFIATGQQRDRL